MGKEKEDSQLTRRVGYVECVLWKMKLKSWRKKVEDRREWASIIKEFKVFRDREAQKSASKIILEFYLWEYYFVLFCQWFKFVFLFYSQLNFISFIG